MTIARKKLLLAAVLTCSVTLTAAQPAQAALIFAATVGGVNFCASDNNVGCGFGALLLDLDPTPGVLNLAALPVIVGGLSFTGITASMTLGSPDNILDISLDVVRNISSTPVFATFAIGATGFTGPVTQAFVSAGGTWQSAAGSTISTTWYNDPQDRQGADTPGDRPGTLLATFNDLASSPVELFSTGTLGPFAVNDPTAFSMTLGLDFTLIAGGELQDFGQSETKPVGATATPVPEPATLSLFGAGLAMAAWRRRTRTR